MALDLAAVLGVGVDLADALAHSVGGFVLAGGIDALDQFDQLGALDLVQPLGAQGRVDVQAQRAGDQQLVLALLDRGQVVGQPDFGPVLEQRHRPHRGHRGRAQRQLVQAVGFAGVSQAHLGPPAVGLGLASGEVVVPP